MEQTTKRVMTKTAALPASALIGTTLAVIIGMGLATMTERSSPLYGMGYFMDCILSLFVPYLAILVTWAFHFQLIGPPTRKLTTGMKMGFVLLIALILSFVPFIAYGLVTGHQLTDTSMSLVGQATVMSVWTSVAFFLSGALIEEIDYPPLRQNLIRAWWTLAIGIPWGTVLILLVKGR